MVTMIGAMGSTVPMALKMPPITRECSTGFTPAAVRPTSAAAVSASTPAATRFCSARPTTLNVRKNTAPMMSTNMGMAVYLPVSTRSILRLRSSSREACGFTTAADTIFSINEKRMSAMAAARSRPRSSSIWCTMCSTASSSFLSSARASLTWASPSTSFDAAKRTGMFARMAWSSIRCMIACRQRCTAPPWSPGSQKSCRPGSSW